MLCLITVHTKTIHIMYICIYNVLLYVVKSKEMTMQTQSKNPNMHVLLYLWISSFHRIPIKLEDLFRSLLTDCDALLQLCRKKTHLCHCIAENSSRLWNIHKYLCIISTNRAMNHEQEWIAASELTSWTEKEPVVDDIKTLRSTLSSANVNNARLSWKRKHKRHRSRA